MSSEPNPRRLVVWAVFLVLPLVAFALLWPILRRTLAPGGSPAVAQATAVAQQAEAAAAAQARRADAALGEGGGAPPAEARPRRDGPTVAEIEASRAADDAAAKAQRGWQKVEVMAPREARAAPGGELVAPFQGFGLSVESTPPGATVRVAGRDVGETPLVTSVDCLPGEPVEVRVVKRALKPATRTVRCRADALVTVAVKLAP